MPFEKVLVFGKYVLQSRLKYLSQTPGMMHMYIHRIQVPHANQIKHAWNILHFVCFEWQVNGDLEDIVSSGPLTISDHTIYCTSIL